jgi:hypothetical protein
MADDKLRNRKPEVAAPDVVRTARANLVEPPEDLAEIIDFSAYDLHTTIRLIVLSGESRRVDVRRGGKKGSVFVKDGTIYRVKTTEGEGDMAFFDVLSWKGALHTDVPQPDAPEANVRISTTVLMDVLRKGAGSTE